MQFGASSSDDAKIAVRRKLRDRLRVFTPAARAAASAEVCAQLTAHFPLLAGQLVAGYLPLPSEPDMSRFYCHVWAVGGRVAFPRLTGPGLMDFRIVPSGTRRPGETADQEVVSASALRSGPGRLWEPDPVRCPVARPEEIGLALIPGLGFAPGGTRLGRGAGYYDRWLPTLPDTTPTVGVAFACQVLPGLPSGPHDRPVHIIVTETGWTAGTRCQNLPPAINNLPGNLSDHHFEM